MKKDRISQEKLIKIAQKEGITLTDRMVNYYTNLNLLPKPVKTKDKSVSDSDKAQNLFEHKHAVFMLQILNNQKSSHMNNIRRRGSYTF